MDSVSINKKTWWKRLADYEKRKDAYGTHSQISDIKVDPARSECGKRAYWDFGLGLERINQLHEPSEWFSGASLHHHQVLFLPVRGRMLAHAFVQYLS